MQEVSEERRDRDPGGGARHLPALAPDAALPRAPARAGASGRGRGSSTSTRASARPAATSRTPRSRRRSTTSSEGRTRLATETGAGQWGSALAFACKLIGLECKVYMVRDLVRPEAVPALDDPDVGRRDRRRARPRTRSAGRAILAEHPDSPGSLGIAISEAVEDAAQRDDTAYSLGSVLNHVLLHQTVIGQEALAQMELAGAFPDVVIGCVGGGSNFAGLAFPFIREKIAGREIDVLALRAGGLPDADARPLRLRLRRHEQADAARPDAHARPRLRPGADPRRRPALPRRRAADLAARPRRADPRRGLPPERRLRLGRAVRRTARGSSRRPSRRTRSTARSRPRAQADEAGEERTILFNLSGHGHFDMAAYDNYFAGKLVRTSRSTRRRSSARCARSRACPRRPSGGGRAFRPGWTRRRRGPCSAACSTRGRSSWRSSSGRS